MGNGLGLGIGHHGGPVTGTVVQEVLDYYEDRLKSLGIKEISDWKVHGPVELAYWKVSHLISEFDADFLEKQKGWEKDGIEMDLRQLEAELASADPEHKPYREEEIRRLQIKRSRTKLLIPQDFRPAMQRGIIGNLDPKAESLSIVFTQNDSKDEWRELGEYTKTSFVDPWPGVHVTICEILMNVQKMVKNAGGDFEIADECEYCDDYQEHARNVG
jgi:hypothetical protein